MAMDVLEKSEPLLKKMETVFSKTEFFIKTIGISQSIKVNQQEGGSVYTDRQ